MKPSPLFALLALALLGAGCSRPTAPAVPTTPAAPVRVATVRTLTETRHLELPGTVLAVERASLAPKVMGSVRSVTVALGQAVKRGDVLLTLSANEIGAKLAQAEAGLNQARRDLERETALVAKGASPAENVRAHEDRLHLMQATVDEARTMLTYTTIAAPFDGAITRRFVNEGDLATPGTPLLELVNPALLRAEVEVPESLAPVAVGTPVEVQVGPTALAGLVAEVSPSSDALSRTFLAKIDLPAGAPVRSGQFARVAWPTGAAPALFVPTAAVTSFGQMERVFVVEGSRAEMRLVKTGLVRGDRVEVLAGLKDGERVVVEGAASLRDGQRLEVSP